MLRSLASMLYYRIFHRSTPTRMALSVALGLVMGFIPIYGFRFTAVLLIALVFGLNLLMLLVGMVIGLASVDLPIFYALIVVLAGFVIFRLIFGLAYRNQVQPRGDKPFVFRDETGYRWSFLTHAAVTLGVLVLVVAGVFIESLDVNPLITGIPLHGTNKFRALSPITTRLSETYISSLLKEQDWLSPTYQLDFQKHRKPRTEEKEKQSELYAFFVNWDENSLVSFKRNIHSIGVLIPEWYHLTTDLGLSNEIQPNVKDLAKAHKVKVVPLVNNYVYGKWDEQLVHRLLQSPENRTRLVEKLHKEVTTNKFDGINIDLENLLPEDGDKLTLFMTQLYARFHPEGLLVTMDVPPGNPAYNLRSLSKVVDRMIVMFYDEHFAGGNPGPIASQKWFEDNLGSVDIPADKMVAALGAYGYDWTENHKQTADVVTFGDVTEMVNQAKLQIQWDSASRNPYLRYQEGGDRHLVWFLDGVTLYNQLQVAQDNGVKGIALWRLGSEDPTVWNSLRNPLQAEKKVTKLSRLTNPEPTHYTGEGEVLKIVAVSSDGQRTITLDKDGLISKENYRVMPLPFEIQRFGKPAGKEVVLTFDDGPDPTYTPEILDILDRYHIKGSFFIVGENADLNQDMIRRIFREGHEIGNHTYTHPNVAETSPRRTRMELNSTQRLLQELTGHSTVLFRPPYVADAEPSSATELLPILRAERMGYTMVGELIDPEDWQRPPAEEIVRRVVNQLPGGNVILLHDSGGDRTNTVKALPVIIETLQKEGYKFVTIGQLLGKSPDVIMPPVPKRESYLLGWDTVVFIALFMWQKGIAALFYLAIILGIIRFIVLVHLSRKQHRKYGMTGYEPGFNPFVSVVIAAYNEEKVICKTIVSILNSDYPNFEVVVVDDGSGDRTAEVARDAFSQDSRVRIIRKENGGKATAVNVGFAQASGDIIVALDADTLIASNAISLLIRHFCDSKVAAVSGNVKVGNVSNLLTLWQHVEYVTGFNLERRAFEELNCITVVPGAIGAWRKDRVAEAGYFKEDTLAEDTDLTLTLLRKGYRIAYEEKAYAYTEAPADTKSLLKQRFRWSYGTLQCLWKHRKALFNRSQPALGFVGLPNMWLFQYVFQSISPIADIYFVLGLFGKSPLIIATFYTVFLLVDLWAAWFAFNLEGESPRPLMWLFLQRLVYRQLMTFVVFKSIISALRGAAVGWNKLQRLGTVEKP